MTNSLTQNVFEKLCHYVETKTRFDSKDLKLISHLETNEPFSISVTHQLEAKVVQINIDGRFHSYQTQNDIETHSPQNFAAAEENERLSLAAYSLEHELAKPEVRYNQIQSGLLLPHARRYWYLSKCGTCHGTRTVTCSSCSGRRSTQCTMCYGGYINCFSCGGSGQRTEQESFQNSRQVSYYENGSYAGSRTEYFTDYRNVQRPCYSCTGGKIICSTCNGTSQVNCSACGATGSVTCSRCNGTGNAGVAAWLDVMVNPEYQYQLGGNARPYSRLIAETENYQGLTEVSHQFHFSSVNTTGSPPHTVNALYNGEFTLVETKVGCAGKAFDVVAYGTDLRWHTMGGIVEQLIEQDLLTLKDLLSSTKADSIGEVRIDHLLEGIKNVISSEVNRDILDLMFDASGRSVPTSEVSTQFSAEIKNNVLNTSRVISLRLAKKFWWKLLLTGVATILILGGMLFLGIVLAWFSILIGCFLFRRQIRSTLKQAMESPIQGEWLFNVLSEAKYTRAATLLVLLPSLALQAVLFYTFVNFQIYSLF